MPIEVTHPTAAFHRITGTANEVVAQMRFAGEVTADWPLRASSVRYYARQLEAIARELEDVAEVLGVDG